jgi:hypothetical protein
MEQRTRIIDIAAAGRTLPATAGASVRRYCLRFNRTIAVATGDSDRSIDFRASSFAFSSPAFSEVTFPWTAFETCKQPY